MRKAVFLDRDGVINALVYDPEHGLVDSPANPEQFELLPGVGEAIRMINNMGLLAVVVSNQPGIAKGKFTRQILDSIDDKMRVGLAKWNARLDAIYYCLHHPQGVVGNYRRDCNCRKPKPGLLVNSGREESIDLGASYMVGDGLTDIQAGRDAGCKTILLGQMKCYLCGQMERMGVKPDFIVADLLEAARLVQRLEGRSENLH